VRVRNPESATNGVRQAPGWLLRRHPKRRRGTKPYERSSGRAVARPSGQGGTARLNSVEGVTLREDRVRDFIFERSGASGNTSRSSVTELRLRTRKDEEGSSNQ
jgi:hypothetical protein